MATDRSKRAAINLALVIIGSISILIVVTVILIISASHPIASAAVRDPNANWVHQKAIECKGDIRQLSQADQQRLFSLYGFPSAAGRIAGEYQSSLGIQ